MDQYEPIQAKIPVRAAAFSPCEFICAEYIYDLSNSCKMHTKLLQKLLRVHVLRKGILCLLGCSVATLKVSDLENGNKKTNNLHDTVYRN